ncbi:MAG: MFS transporter [Conexivisphaerales archaeon]
MSDVQEGKLDASGNIKEQENNTTVNAGQNVPVSSTRIPWGAIIALAMGMLVYGVAESYGPVIAITGVIPSEYAWLGLSAPFIAAGVGALLAGYLTDKLGRRDSFIIVAAMILIGIIIFLVASTNVVAIVISFLLIGMAAIGLETPVITSIAESIPAKWRGNLEVIVQNFGNLGLALVFIPVLLGLSAFEDDVAYVLLFIAPLAALIIGYWTVKESVPWKAVTGKIEENIKEAWSTIDNKGAETVNVTSSLGFRFLTITILGIAQDVGFVYITYDVAYIYFQSSVADEIPIIGGLFSVVVGILLAIFFVHRISRKIMTTISYGLMVLLWALFWGFEVITHSTAGITLLFLMALLFLPAEAEWGSRAMLEPEMFPTKKRGTYISIVRFLVWVIAGSITAVLSYYYTTPFNIEVGVVMTVFVIAFVFALIWQFKGFETGKKSLSGYDVKKQP